MSVFVTDAGYKHTLAVVRSLGRKDIMVDVGSTSNSMQLSHFSRYVNESFFYPDPRIDPEGFASFISNALKKMNYRVVIPVGYDATVALSMKKKDMGCEARIPVADFSSLKTAANKGETILLAEQIGIPVPKTTFPSSLLDLDSFLDDFSYPVVVKGLYGSGLIHYAYNKEDLKNKAAQIYRLQDVPPLLQELVEGEGYGFFALFNHGDPRAVFMHRRIREYPITGGSSTCAESVYVPEVMNYGLKLLEFLEWHGVAMVEFKRDMRDGELKLMEINPKFWGSLDLGIASGIDFPYLLYKMVINGDVNPSFSYKLGVRFMWPFPDDLLRLREKPRDLICFLSDILNPSIAKNISFDDLRPTFFPAAKFFSQVAFEITKKG